MYEKPLVSVNMPAYNGAKFIWEAISSILNQTFQHFELIVVNDGSTDATHEIVSQFTDQRIRMISRTENKGLAFTRNEALRQSSGKYVAVLDCDDIALPCRLADQVAFLEANPDYALAGSWVQPIGSEGKPAGPVWQYGSTSEELKAGLLLRNQFAQPSVMLRRDAIPEEGYSDDFPPAEDYELWLRIARKAKVANLPKVLTYYRLHADNISSLKNAVVQEKDRVIRFNQLNFLLDDFTPADAEIFEVLTGAESHGKYRQIDFLLLLDRILEANQKRNIYDPYVLAEILSSYWQKTLIEGPEYNPALLMLYLKSSFRHTHDLTIRQKSGFLLKCLAHRKKTHQ